MKDSGLREQIFDLLYSQKKPEQAILQLNRIIKASPEHSEALALKAYALNKLANSLHDWKYTQHAFASAERALAFNPDDDIALISKGWALIDLGRAKDALSPLQKATRANPANEYAWYNLAWAQYLTGDALGSKDSIERALRINPGNPILKQGKRMMENGEIPAHLRKK
ncbi:MAG TPA: tetratricopeptide repeat protein [Candidatus Hodarchaeales archaeon]|nr:tetratricopeptide repeat protein [Candidatus Hodarchaeales archaeon]